MTEGQEGRASVGVLTGYYLATPLFALLDVAWSFPVRAAAISSPLPRMLYYGLLVLLGVACRLRPRLAPWIGMGESAFLVTLLMLGVLTPLWDALETGVVPEARLVQTRTLNLALSGAVLLIGFYRQQAETVRRRGPGPGAPRVAPRGDGWPSP